MSLYVAGGLLLMETTKFVVAVTQHVVLMVNFSYLNLWRLVAFALSKVAFDSSALSWLFSFL